VKLSYSSIHTYETCPAKYRFQYEDRLPTGTSPALAFGDSLHRALHRFHDRPVPVAPSLGELQEILEGEWVSDGYRDPSEESLYLAHARQVLDQYHRENASSFRIPAALEFRFRIDIEGVEVNGVIDRMDRIPGGGYEIIDYKTSRRLPPKAVIDRDLQLSVYYLAAKEIWDIEPERLTLYFLLPGERTSFAVGWPQWPSGSRPGSSSRARIRSATGASSRPGARSSATSTNGWKATPLRTCRRSLTSGSS
jgi:RecB family exonuclease